MTTIQARNVPDSVARVFAQLAHEHGLSQAAYLRELITEAVQERSYRAEASDPERIAYQEARRASRAERATRRERRESTA